jgi:hypothetical protein
MVKIDHIFISPYELQFLFVFKFLCPYNNQLNPMVESHGLHKVVLPKKGNEYSWMGCLMSCQFYC